MVKRHFFSVSSGWIKVKLSRRSVHCSLAVCHYCSFFNEICTNTGKLLKKLVTFFTVISRSILFVLITFQIWHDCKGKSQGKLLEGFSALELYTVCCCDDTLFESSKAYGCNQGRISRHVNRQSNPIHNYMSIENKGMGRMVVKSSALNYIQSVHIYCIKKFQHFGTMQGPFNRNSIIYTFPDKGTLGNPEPLNYFYQETCTNSKYLSSVNFTTILHTWYPGAIQESNFEHKLRIWSIVLMCATISLLCTKGVETQKRFLHRGN